MISLTRKCSNLMIFPVNHYNSVNKPIRGQVVQRTISLPDLNTNLQTNLLYTIIKK